MDRQGRMTQGLSKLDLLATNEMVDTGRIRNFPQHPMVLSPCGDHSNLTTMNDRSAGDTERGRLCAEAPEHRFNP